MHSYSRLRMRTIGLTVGLLAVFTCQWATAQEPQWWTNQKANCGLSPSLDYNSWAASGSPCNARTAAPAAPAAPTQQRRTPAAPAAPAGPTMQQQMGLALGQAAMPILQKGIHDLFYGTPPKLPDPAQQQRAFAAQQLDNSGMYLLSQKTRAGTEGAKNEFLKALNQTPNDGNILHHLAMAEQQLKDLAAAEQTRGALNRVLPPAPPANKGVIGGELTHGSVPSPNASALSLVNLDPNVVDLRNATSASPKSLKSQLDEVFGKAPASAPPAKMVNPNDGPQQNKAEIDAVFAKPKQDPDAMMKKIFDLNDKSE